MRKNKTNSDSDESMSSKIAKEEHFVTTNQAFKDPNAVYIEDNPQKALEQLLNLSKNQNYKEKLQYVKHLAELVDLIGDDGIDKLGQIISTIRDDKDEIKRAILTQISPLTSLLQQKGDKGYKVIVDVIVATVSKLINSNNIDIKEASGQELTKIAAILSEDDRGKHLLTIVLGMAHDDESEDNRMIAVRLLSQMAPVFGKDLCEQFVGLEFLSMGEDPQLRVRKEAVANLPSIAKVVSPHFFRQRLLPFYLKLCKDANWGVRKSCIDIIYEIATICKGELKEVKENELTEMTLNFLKDSNKWVKVSAYKNLGPFISTLQGLKVNEKLVESYLHMADNNINNLAPENEIIYACAYNFPAVVLTLGPSRWSTLVKLFQTLMKSNDKVKKPLACSLHEIAKIIGEEKAEKDLLGALERFLKDINDDIKYGAIQNLALFLQVFHIDKRENMVDIFLDLQKDQKKWRIRELIAQQIDKLTQVFPPEITFRIIAPISFKLCNDSVAFVRDKASKKIYSIVKALDGSEQIYRDSIIENIKGFSVSNRYTNRQAFATMCERLMKYPDLFKEHFLPQLVPLADDKVPNVRISLAKTLHKLYKKKRQLCSDPQIIQLVRKLKNDPSKDVKSFLQQIDLPNGEIAQEKTQTEETKTEAAKPEKLEESKENLEKSTEVLAHHEESHVVPVDEETAHKVEEADEKDDHLEVLVPPTTNTAQLRKKSAELEAERKAIEEAENQQQQQQETEEPIQAENSENKEAETENTEANGAQEAEPQANTEDAQPEEESIN